MDNRNPEIEESSHERRFHLQMKYLVADYRVMHKKLESIHRDYSELNDRFARLMAPLAAKRVFDCPLCCHSCADAQELRTHIMACTTIETRLPIRTLFQDGKDEVLELPEDLPALEDDDGPEVYYAFPNVHD